MSRDAPRGLRAVAQALNRPSYTEREIVRMLGLHDVGGYDPSLGSGTGDRYADADGCTVAQDDGILTLPLDIADVLADPQAYRWPASNPARTVLVIAGSRTCATSFRESLRKVP